MAKSDRNRSDKAKPGKGVDKAPKGTGKKAFDPSLASLFASSLGPVQAPPKSRYQNVLEKPVAEQPGEDEAQEDIDNDAELSELESEQSGSADESHLDAEDTDEAEDVTEDSPDDEDSASEQSQADDEAVLARLQESVLNGEQDRPSKKRKRANKGEEVEDVYMRKLAQEEVKDEERRKKQRTEAAEPADEDASSGSNESDGETYTIPKHETLEETEPKDNQELEKAARTVFLGNVSNDAITSKSAKKQLERHLASFIADLADHDPPHKLESIRFRSTAFASALPKKAAFVKKDVLDATTKSTNAYAVYSTQVAAREATKRLNGTVVLKRHLRVDWLAHPAPVDHRRCVFVGNLGYVDDETDAKTDEDDSKKKKKPPSDVEEGLWVHFGKAGKVESVRVVRDPKTRVGKGFAYVQFEDENGVEAALQFNDQKFPPELPRKLRVVRAKAQRPKKKPAPRENPSKSTAIYNAKKTEEQKSQEGRAKKMLGKAGVFKAAESFVFEGHRASSKQGHSGLKLGGRKGKGKSTNRSKKRAAAWKASGGKKPVK